MDEGSYILVGLACSGLEVVYNTRGCLYRLSSFLAVEH